ncbi:MAG: hypothetical protein ABIA93_07450 [Candidatus Woesearchaeota archaeon]
MTRRGTSRLEPYERVADFIRDSVSVGYEVESRRAISEALHFGNLVGRLNQRGLTASKGKETQARRTLLRAYLTNPDGIERAIGFTPAHFSVTEFIHAADTGTWPSDRHVSQLTPDTYSVATHQRKSEE